jgi:hypothetical protein
VAEGALTMAGVPPAVAFGIDGRVPGWRDWRPRGVSRMTRKWPVKGGESAAGRCSGSIW